MKRKFFLFVTAAMIFAVLAGCASGATNGMSGTDGQTKDNANAVEGEADFYRPQDAQDGYEYAEPAPMAAADDIYMGAEQAIAPIPPDYSTVAPGDKIIYSASATVETLDFEQTVVDLEALISSLGGFVEYMYDSGAPITAAYEDGTYHRASGYRSANYTFRVPKDVFESAKDSLSQLGNVTALSTNARNITGQYTDTESRLKMYRTEEERLLLMLARAETVSDMIVIEQTLSQVRYNIESLTTQLNSMDLQVDYSTITLTIREVERLTVVTEPNRSYTQQLIDGFAATLKNVGLFFADLFKFIVINIPVFVIIAVVLIAVIVLYRRRRRKNIFETEDNDV